MPGQITESSSSQCTTILNILSAAETELIRSIESMIASEVGLSAAHQARESVMEIFQQPGYRILEAVGKGFSPAQLKWIQLKSAEVMAKVETLREARELSESNAEAFGTLAHLYAGIGCESEEQLKDRIDAMKVRLTALQSDEVFYKAFEEYLLQDRNETEIPPGKINRLVLQVRI